MGKVFKNKLHGMGWHMKAILILLITLTSMFVMHLGGGSPDQSFAAGIANIADCSGCHGYKAGSARPVADGNSRNNPEGTLVGSHNKHVITNGIDCAVCHVTPATTTSSDFKHANGLIQMQTTFGTPYLGSYWRNSFAVYTGSIAHLGTCSTNCHGSAAPTWGANLGAVQCAKCHSDTSATSTFVDTGGVSYTWGGAINSNLSRTHVSHLYDNPNYIGTNLICNDCHNVPATPMAAGHYDSTAHATVTFHSLTAAKGGLSPVYNANTRKCNNTWCHGAGLTTNKNNLLFGTVTAPSFFTRTPALNATSADCGKCHGYPPGDTAAGQNHNGVTVGTQCKGCHTHVNAAGTGFDDITKHLNGKVDSPLCTACHANEQSAGAVTRRAVVADMQTGQSHHVQGIETLDGKACYQCHGEANSDGTINATYHKGGGSVSGAAVVLAAWNNTGGRASASYVDYTANGKRAQISKLNAVCMGCHSTPNQIYAPFGKYSTHRYSPEARLGMAKTSIQSRYSSSRTVAWSPYNNFSSVGGQNAKFGTNSKNRITKALSAHGNADSNQMINWDTTKGEEVPVANASSKDSTYSGNSGNRNVFCYDCHNSHGSNATGITSSYSSATGRYKGGLLKTTVANRGGYASTYTPAARTVTYRQYSGVGNIGANFNPGASLCNDCHNKMNPRGATLTKPWGVMSTFSSSGNRWGSIGGYWSTPYFDNYTVATALRTTYKQGLSVGTTKDYRKPMGGHYGTSVNNDSVNSSTNGHTPTTSIINGLCTPCHDPHGVSNSLGSNRQYAVPLLKGTWITSPYMEDKADTKVTRGGGSQVSNFGLAGAIPGYHIDQNTLLTQPLPNNGGATNGGTSVRNGRRQAFRNISNSASGLQPFADTQFAGLCTQCHSKSSLTNSTVAASTSNWRTKNRIHQSVDGWAATTGTGGNMNNKVHAYTCAKCHTPHVSRLPRLMVTNCLDYNHTGQVPSGGTLSATTGSTTANYGNVLQNTVRSAYGAGRFPAGGAVYSGGNGVNPVARSQNNGPWWFQTITVDGTTPNYGSNCHASGTANGAAGTDPKTPGQRWNNKTEW